MNTNAPSSPPPKYPILKLIPLTEDQCASELGCTAVDKNNAHPQEHQQQQDERTTMALKLCNESNDIFDVDNYSPSQTIEPTRYAKYDDNGNYSVEMKLGRSVHAKIKWTMISRALLDIGMTRAARRKNDMNDINSSNGDGSGSVVTAWIKMRKEEEQHRVHLNGKLITAQVGKQIAVNDGTILSLYGPLCYAYRISIQSNGATINPSSSLSSSLSKKRGADDTENNNNDGNNANNSKRMKLQGVKKDAHQLFENESECPLCHELLVKTVATHPCGHSFCGECADTYLKTTTTTASSTANASSKKSECPSCRSEISGFTRNRTVDTMIWAAALTGTFDRDDASNYLMRMEQAGERVATEEEKECILRCGNGEHHEDIMNGGSQMNGLVFMDPQTSATKVTHVPTLAPLYPTSTTTLRHGQTKAKSSSMRNQVVDLTL
jgi:hypothetical protein